MTGLMAGVYFTFSVFVMKSLAELPVLQAVQAMNKINDVIVNTLFLPVFFGSTLCHAGLIVWQFADWQSDSLLLIIAAVIYIVGMFLVTAFGNVPLNNRLKENEANESRLPIVWAYYLHKWTRLNHIRTMSCIVSLTLLSISQT
jgi:uncharacterized membrane protein